MAQRAARRGSEKHKKIWMHRQTDANFICQTNPNGSWKTPHFSTTFCPLNLLFYLPFCCFGCLVHQQYQCRGSVFPCFPCLFCAQSNFLWGIVWLDFPAFICVKVAKFMLYGAEILIRKLANLALQAKLGKTERTSSCPGFSTSHVTAQCELPLLPLAERRRR